MFNYNRIYLITCIVILGRVKSYNELRPHASCDYLTPNQAHLQSDKLNKRWKNYNKSFYQEKSIV